MNKIKIATAQFPVSGDITRNLRYIIKLVNQAKNENANVIHFSETCLGGYAGTDFVNWDNYDWQTLKLAKNEILQCAKKLKIGIIYGTNHRISAEDTRNSLIYVSKEGKTVTRYDKRFCTEGDLKHYKSGKHFSTFDIGGFKCGMLICYDVRFPELYREYKKLDIQIMFHSFYNARSDGRNIHTTIMRPTLQTRAATNYFYISANNSSGYYQSWPSVFILPDGSIKASCPQHKTSMIINSIRQQDKYYDVGVANRDRAMSGKLFSE